MWGGNLKGWSKTQSVIALSSGEAELAATVKGSTEALGMQSVLEDFCISVSLRIRSDASAAIGMVKRDGLGKVRHLAVADLWIQSKQASGEITYEKIDGKCNPADMMTKGIDKDAMANFLGYLGFLKLLGRHRLCPKLLT